jgi:hypothetical protein
VRLLRIGAGATEVVGTAADLAEARRHYAAEHHLLLEGFLHPELLASVRARIDEVAFEGVEACGTELRLENGRAFDLMEFLLNDRALHAAVEALTGCGPIGCYQGRIYRMGAEHVAKWHNDVVDTRLVAMTINVSPAPYEGGGVAVKEVHTGRILDIPAPAIGDALIFRIGDDLTHKNTDIVGPAAKTAVAGWFRREPRFADLLFQAVRGG